MAAAFTLWGEIKADTMSFEQALSRAESKLKSTEQAIAQGEQKARQLGDTTAKTGRTYEKFNESVDKSRQRMLEAVAAYQRGDISAKRLATEFARVDTNVSTLNSKLKDNTARLTDWSNRSTVAMSAFKGALGALGVTGFSIMAKNFAEDGIKMYASLDKLTRFTATLDKSFQSPQNLRKFQEDIKKLSTEIPHSAENIAKASFQIKSAYQNLTEPELIEFLREFGNAATASNTDIATHAFNMAALAKQYGITKTELRSFGALMSTAFGNALATDAKVAEGFNRILSSAKSTHQPLADMAAAMGTLQSASSDAEFNTTLLQNVYAKLTDKKYIQGIEAMGVAFYTASGQARPLNDLINDLAQKLSGLNDQQISDKLAWAKDQQAREGLKTLVRLVGDYNKILADGADEEAFKKKNELMLNSVEAKWERFVNKVNNAKMSLGGGVVDFADEVKTLNPKVEVNSEVLRGVIIKGLRGAITGAYADAQPIMSSSGQSLGRQMDLGMQMGIAGGQSGVINSVISLAQAAYYAAKDALGIQSPSKLFKELGKDTAQGYIDGLASMRTGVQNAIANLLDVSKLKTPFNKNDVAGIELLTSLIKDLDDLTERTRLEGVMAELTAGKYAKLNKEIKDRIILAAKQLDFMERLSKRFDMPDMTGENQGRNTDTVGEGTGGIGSSMTPEQLEKSYAAMLDIGVAALPAQRSWSRFWSMMQLEIAKFKQTLPTIKQVIGENLLNSIQGIGDVFGNAIQQWDGTAKGFFKSLAAGFRSLVAQILSELVRLMVVKAVMQLIGSFAGGISSGGGGGGIPEHGGFGGVPAGLGRAGSTGIGSLGGIPAGRGFTPVMPSMAYAGGGSSRTINNSPNITINLTHTGGGDMRNTAEQIQRAVIAALHKHERRNK